MTDVLKHPFSAAAIKIQRARRHLAELEDEVAAFLASGPAKMDTAVTNVPGKILFTNNFRIENVPEIMGAIIGDIIHNLRTALDLTACEMVRVKGQGVDSVYFPFCRGPDELDGMIKRRNFDRAGPDAIALLRELKPYHGGNAALRTVHDLDVRDKHQSLIPTAVSAATPAIQLWEDDGRFNPRLIGDPSKPGEVKLVFPGDSVDRQRELISTMHELVELVAGVVEAFRALANRNVPESA